MSTMTLPTAPPVPHRQPAPQRQPVEFAIRESPEMGSEFARSEHAERQEAERRRQEALEQLGRVASLD